MAAITSWNDEDKPREKFESCGPEALSKAELMAILVGSGSTKMTVVELMRKILGDHNDSIHEIERLSVKQLEEYDGIGPAKAITILAACAIANRYAAERVNHQKMSSSEEIAAYFSTRIANLPHEECHVMLLDNSLKLISSHLISKGGLASTSVDVRQVMKEAIVRNSTSIVLCHNHPSGSLVPSRHDDDLTQRVKTATQTLGIHFLDHIIVSVEGHYSYRENGKL